MAPARKARPLATRPRGSPLLCSTLPATGTSVAPADGEQSSRRGRATASVAWAGRAADWPASANGGSQALRVWAGVLLRCLVFDRRTGARAAGLSERVGKTALVCSAAAGGAKRTRCNARHASLQKARAGCMPVGFKTQEISTMRRLASQTLGPKPGKRRARQASSPPRATDPLQPRQTRCIGAPRAGQASCTAGSTAAFVVEQSFRSWAVAMATPRGQLDPPPQLRRQQAQEWVALSPHQGRNCQGWAAAVLAAPLEGSATLLGARGPAPCAPATSPARRTAEAVAPSHVAPGHGSPWPGGRAGVAAAVASRAARVACRSAQLRFLDVVFAPPDRHSQRAGPGPAATRLPARAAPASLRLRRAGSHAVPAGALRPDAPNGARPRRLRHAAAGTRRHAAAGRWHAAPRRCPAAHGSCWRRELERG